MILGKVELLAIAILLSKNIAQCDDRAGPRGATTARRDDRAAVGLAWTGRNLILDEALGPMESFDAMFIVGIYSGKGIIITSKRKLTHFF